MKNTSRISKLSNPNEKEDDKVKSELGFVRFIETFKNKLKLLGNSEHPTKSKRTNHHHDHQFQGNQTKPILINKTTTSTLTKPVTPITKPSYRSSTGNLKSNQQTPIRANPIAIQTNSSDSTIERCQGTTREGKPCSRKPMKQPTSTLTHQALNQLETLLDSHHQVDQISHSLPTFCFQHYKLNLNQLGTFLFNGKYIQFNDWISDELPNQTKLILRNEMIKPITNQDKQQKGYIYCHEMIPDRSTNTQSYPSTTSIKVGRSIQPIRRLSQWKTQCPSKQPIIRDVFPLLENHGLNSYQLGCEKVSEIGLKFHHRWERLCLIELNAWSDLQSIQRNRLFNIQSNQHVKCQDCGKLHLELFVFDVGSYERFIKKLIIKWQRWCEYAYE